MVHTLVLFAAETTEKGGLFDLNATLPTIILEFLLLAFLLNQIFYGPLTQVIDQRNEFIRSAQAEAKQQMEQVEGLATQFQSEIAQARMKAQQLISDAEASVMKVRAQKISEVQAEAQSKLEAAQQMAEQEKQAALQQLQAQVDDLSQQIAQKLLGTPS